MANLYQDALTRQLGGRTKQVNAPGMIAPVDPTSVIEPPAPEPSPTQTPAPAPTGGGTLKDILGKYQYGAGGLGAAKNDLAGIGFDIQERGSGGGSPWASGRLKERSTGNIYQVFDPREGRTEANNWNNNPIADGQWTIENLGNEGLDAGGWSFGGPSSDMLPSSIPMPTQTPQTWEDVAVSGDVGIDPGNQRSPFLEALLAQLGGQT